MASAEYEQLLAGIDRALVSANDSLEVAKAKLEALHGHPLAETTSVDWGESGGVRVARVVTPECESASAVVLLCHGGAFIAAGGDGYLFYAEMLARACAAPVVLVDYRLAPAHRFPAALNDCVQAYRGLIDTEVAADRVVFVGDSCGGGLAVASLIEIGRAGVAQPAGAVALGGWFDLEAGGDAARDPLGRDPFADAAFTRARGRDYLGPDGDLRDPLASPLHCEDADLVGLPPLLLQVGQIDLTRSDAVCLAERAGRCGVAVTLEVWPEMVHGFQGLAAAGVPEGLAALAHVGRFVRESVR